MKDFIPKSKSDDEAVRKLHTKSIIEVKPFLMELLEWIKDSNWSIAKDVSDYLVLYVNEFEDEIISILHKDNNDDCWKYSLLYLIILRTQAETSEKVLSSLKRIYFFPTKGELDELVHEAIADNFNFDEP